MFRRHVAGPVAARVSHATVDVWNPSAASGTQPAASFGTGGQASSNFAMTRVSASPSRVHSWNAGSAIIVSM